MRNNTRKAALSGLATLGVAALLAGCASAPDAPSASGGGATVDVKPCMVSDSGGFDDRSFNQLGREGLEAAAESLGVEPRLVESQTDADYEQNISGLLDAGCTLIVSVGYKLADATRAAAEANPDTQFAIIDDASIDLPNVKPIEYNTAEAAFLAGYAAAATTKTGVVATWGGLPIPPVTIFMDGFVEGVEHYNQENGTQVRTLGWDVEAQNGTFIGSFDAGVDAKTQAEGFIQQNADVLLPVGGPIFLSAAEAIRDVEATNPDIALIGVDADLYETSPNFKDLFLTSITKGMATGVETVVEDAAAGNFSSEPYVGDLENEGVGLAPFHDYESVVPADLQSQLDTIRAAIISGDIKVTSPSAP